MSTSFTRAVRARVLWVATLLSVLSACGGGGGGSSGTPPPVTAAPSDLQYPAAPTFVINTAIAPLTPSVDGEVTSYGVSPALPAGLSLSTTSGAISGTPTSVAAKASYTVKATNAGGSTTASVSIVVMSAATAAPSDLNYPTPPTLVVGTAIAPLKPSVHGDVTSYSVSPALPAGLSLDTTSGVISGTPTSVTAKASHTVTATNWGGSTTATVSIVVTATAPGYTAKSGVAQKGPLIQGSTVTAQELDANLSPTGQQFSYQILTNLGNFSPTSTFTSQYIGLNASGYYFDEVQNATSSAPITLNGYSDLATDSVLNVNILTTLEYQRIQNLVTKSNLTFAAARTQAEGEVLAVLSIPPASYGYFSTLDLSGNTDGDHILAAISSIFVYGNTASSLSVLMANFQSDIGKNGVITVSATKTALAAASKAVNATSVAANLTQYYSSFGITFSAADITDWIDQDGDGVVGKFKFQVADATPSSTFTFPAFVQNQVTGTSVSATGGQLLVNGRVVNGSTRVVAGDTVAVSSGVGAFTNGILNVYLLSGTTRTARVSFVSGLLSIAVTPSNPSVPTGLTTQLSATGTFSDGSRSDVTSIVSWSSSTPSVATIGTTGLASGVTLGSSTITATSGGISGATLLTVSAAILESIAVTPSSPYTGIGLTEQLTATGTLSDGTSSNLTNSVAWSSGTPAVATINSASGIVTGVSLGATVVTAASAGISGRASFTVTNNPWSSAGTFPTQPVGATLTSLHSGAVLLIATDNRYALNMNALYNPSTNTWTAVPALNTMRSNQTATLLPNGKVLVAGGWVSGGSAPTATAEIYDPVANTWTAAASMNFARTVHAATPLQNGKVLVVSGWIGGTDTASAELYDPTANTWSLAGNLAIAREYSTATLLPNGKVLVVGGAASAELYDPTANSWSSAGTMDFDYAYATTATLLPSGNVIVIGALGPINDLYSPATNTWSPAGSLLSPRMWNTATLLPSGMVLVAGGQTTLNGAATSSVELFDPASNTSTSVGALPSAVQIPVATLLNNGKVLVIEPAGAELSWKW